MFAAFINEDHKIVARPRPKHRMGALWDDMYRHQSENDAIAVALSWASHMADIKDAVRIQFGKAPQITKFHKIVIANSPKYRNQ